jgi:superfamily II DNA or RNA helicase
MTETKEIYRPTNLKPVPFQLYEFQKPIVQSMINTIVSRQNGLVVQPTGTGKTVEAAFAVRAAILLHKKRGLYVYNANDGLEQARKTFEIVANGNNIIYADFYGYGKDDHVTDADIVFASFQSLNHYQSKWYTMFDSNHFDFIIVNEGHHAQATTYREVLDYFNCSKIGMSATPTRMDGKDILDIFGEEIANIPIEEAIVKGYISKIEYHVLSNGLSGKQLREICQDVVDGTKRISLKQLNETIFVEKLNHEIAQEIGKYAFPEYGKPLQTIIFCENIRHANIMQTLLSEKKWSAAAIHSGRAKGFNRNTLQQFKSGQIQFLIAVDQLNEDIDIPQVGLGVFLRSTSSNTIWLQQLGRLLRKTPLKQKAIVLDFVANVERLIAVQELSKRIVETAEKNNLLFPDLDKSILNVSGDSFDFSFSDTTISILKAFDAISQGRYATWQEASTAIHGLGIISQSSYNQNYKKDSKLPSNLRGYYSDFPGWKVFLRSGGETLYTTWQSASIAARALGIVSGVDYKKNYKKDLKLPNDPYFQYPDFPGWRIFLGGEQSYATWQEASIATQALGICSSTDYRKSYKKDPKLPSSPYNSYPDFPGWITFFGKEKRETLYATWQEASIATQALEIISQSDYNKSYKKDSKLPGNPYRFYSNFPGWITFFGKEKRETPYATWQEAGVKARALGVISKDDYRKNYKKDPKLPSNPHGFYADFPGWKIFLGK